MSNLELWNRLSTTDPAFTKPVETPFKHTSIRPHYLVRRATDEFGPVGQGWGYDYTETVTDGAPLADGGFEKTHQANVTLWYVREGQRREVCHTGTTKYVYKSKFGPTTDHEAPKKSVTDGIGKCLSMIGVAADIHLGLFDDPVYLESAAVVAEAARTDQDVEKRAQVAEEYATWRTGAIETLENAPNLNAAQILFKTATIKANARGDQATVVAVKRAFDSAVARLQADQEGAA